VVKEIEPGEMPSRTTHNRWGFWTLLIRCHLGDDSQLPPMDAKMPYKLIFGKDVCDLV